MKHYLLPIFTLVLLAVSFSCEKEEPNDPEPSELTMPPLTHQGLNTFGCYIDGELFVANDGESVWSLPALSGSFNEENKRLSVQGSRELERTDDYTKADDVRLSCIVTDDEGEYAQFVEIEEYLGYSSVGIGNCDYYHDISNAGVCTISYLDEENNIISGTFSMTLTNKYCDNDSIMEITDGRFDFRY